MKVLVNGGLNLSELDGWWAEAYSPEVGWAIGDGKEHGDDPAWDAHEAEDLYALLEREVVTEFYERDEANTPSKWLGRIRESMARLTPEFSATRAIRECTDNHYLPAASNYQERAVEVVFPTGIDRRDDLGTPYRFDVYYGMADNRIGAARLEPPERLPVGVDLDTDVLEAMV